jgi:hypothetical protein
VGVLHQSSNGELGIEKLRCSERNLPQCYLVHHKFHMGCCGLLGGKEVKHRGGCMHTHTHTHTHEHKHVHKHVHKYYKHTRARIW